MRALTLVAAGALLFALPAAAGPVTLKSHPADVDGVVTLGDIFDGAGAASAVAVGRRSGPSIVFEASQLQAMAHQAGLAWSNPNGLRRIVVRSAEATPAMAATAAPATARTSPSPVVRAPSRPTYADRIISRNDIVEVAYEADGVRLTITGRAEGAAAPGQRLAIRNLQSGRIFDAVAVAPGQAITGPAARPQQFAAR